ncbi:two-component system regulatory protein YycI [Atopobacter phocae]|uniref:two-component system regulatory protein YycI n=1 Tax=Atopobacter phocae TaxID=136492 RepID=UPI00046EA67E|nr:two-component system regulatory protein YycI [Atopobacter phocae]
MDFKQSKLILMMAFLALNIFLGYFYIERRNLNQTSIADRINVQQEMRNDNITFDSLDDIKQSLPLVKTSNSEVGQLEANEITFSPLTNSNSAKPISLVSPLDIRKSKNELDFSVIDKFLKEEVNEGTTYQFVSYYPIKREVVYAQQVNQVPIMDGTGQITFYLNSQNEVASYTQTVIKQFKSVEEKRVLISEKKATEILYLNNLLPRNSEIVSSTLAYYRILKLENMSVYSPIWYFDIKSDDIITSHRINAINGNIITPEVRKINEEMESN